MDTFNTDQLEERLSLFSQGALHDQTATREANPGLTPRALAYAREATLDTDERVSRTLKDQAGAASLMFGLERDQMGLEDARFARSQRDSLEADKQRFYDDVTSKASDPTEAAHLSQKFFQTAGPSASRLMPHAEELESFLGGAQRARMALNTERVAEIDLSAKERQHMIDQDQAIVDYRAGVAASELKAKEAELRLQALESGDKLTQIERTVKLGNAVADIGDDEVTKAFNPALAAISRIPNEDRVAVSYVFGELAKDMANLNRVVKVQREDLYSRHNAEVFAEIRKDPSFKNGDSGNNLEIAESMLAEARKGDNYTKTRALSSFVESAKIYHDSSKAYSSLKKSVTDTEDGPFSNLADSGSIAEAVARLTTTASTRVATYEANLKQQSDKLKANDERLKRSKLELEYKQALKEYNQPEDDSWDKAVENIQYDGTPASVNGEDGLRFGKDRNSKFVPYGAALRALIHKEANSIRSGGPSILRENDGGESESDEKVNSILD